MTEPDAVLPAAWNALISVLCREAPYLQSALAPELARFSQARLASGCLAAAFNTSLLAYNGCPLEFTLSSSKPLTLSCTLDPFLPRYAEDRSVEAFYRHYRRITAAQTEASPEPYLEAVKCMQRQTEQPLRFGSWLGRKYTPEGVKTKVYSEVPAGGYDEAGWPSGMAEHPNHVCKEIGRAHV